MLHKCIFFIIHLRKNIFKGLGQAVLQDFTRCLIWHQINILSLAICKYIYFLNFLRLIILDKIKRALFC